MGSVARSTNLVAHMALFHIIKLICIKMLGASAHTLSSPLFTRICHCKEIYELIKWWLKARSAPIQGIGPETCFTGNVAHFTDACLSCLNFHVAEITFLHTFSNLLLFDDWQKLKVKLLRRGAPSARETWIFAAGIQASQAGLVALLAYIPRIIILGQCKPF